MRDTALVPKTVLALLVVICLPVDIQSAAQGGPQATTQSGTQSGAQSPGHSGADLTWTEHPALTWDDFNAQPPKSVAYPSALSDTGFKFQLVCRNGMLDVDAAAFFSPSGSWVNPTTKNADLLKHEQGHYDMAELYALRLRQAILAAKIGCDDKAKANAAGEKMVAEFQRDWQNAERQYEEGTRYGTDLAKQEVASNMIATELAALKGANAANNANAGNPAKQ
jgi:hypothetical protein